MVKKVVIIGAGPCGLLLAHYLLSRKEQYQVEIYERRTDPRIVSYSNSRTFPIAVNDRGYNALSKIPGLEQAVKANSTVVTHMVSHQKNGKAKVVARSKPLLIIDRNDLVKVLLEQATSKYRSSKLKINFDCKCDGAVTSTKENPLNLTQKTIKLRNLETETDFKIDYDILIGADGASSVVREIFANLSDSFEYSQEYLPNAYKSIYLSPSDNKNHYNRQQGKFNFWNIDNHTRILLLELTDGSFSGVIRFLYQKNSIANISGAEEASLYFQENCLQLKELMSAAEIEAFANNPISRISTVSCNRYHLGESALLIGDAIHAVSPALGQGCNSSLEDVWILNNLLDEYNDNWRDAIEQFTIRRKIDADAVLELSNYTSPLSRRLSIELAIRQSIKKVLHRLFPQYFLPPLFEYLSQPYVRYSEILSNYQGWVSKVKKSNQKLLAKLS